jgi:hypothetical protein
VSALSVVAQNNVAGFDKFNFYVPCREEKKKINKIKISFCFLKVQ